MTPFKNAKSDGLLIEKPLIIPEKNGWTFFAPQPFEFWKTNFFLTDTATEERTDTLSFIVEDSGFSILLRPELPPDTALPFNLLLPAFLEDKKTHG